MRQLVEHLGEVHRTWTASVEQRAEDFDDIDRSDVFWSPLKGDLLAWFEDGLAALVRALRSTPEEATFWTWWPPQRNVAFLRRRMAHENAVHRWDCQAAHGEPTPVDPRLAADGIDELLTVYLQRWAEPRGAGEEVSFHATDTGDAWSVRIGDGTLEVRAGALPAGAWVEGKASEVLLALWGRVPLGRLVTEGDLTPLRQLLAEADFD